MTIAPTRLSAGPTVGSLLTEADLGRDRFLELVDLAAELKTARQEGREVPRLRGKNIALIFEKASTRTRCAFEVAAADQGATTTYLGPDGSHIGREESIARVVARNQQAGSQTDQARREKREIRPTVRRRRLLVHNAIHSRPFRPRSSNPLISTPIFTKLRTKEISKFCRK